MIRPQRTDHGRCTVNDVPLARHQATGLPDGAALILQTRPFVHSERFPQVCVDVGRLSRLQTVMTRSFPELVVSCAKSLVEGRRERFHQ